MAGQQYKSKKRRHKSEKLALVERCVFLVIAVVLALASVVSPLVGVHGMFPATEGVGAGLSMLGGYFKR